MLSQGQAVAPSCTHGGLPCPWFRGPKSSRHTDCLTSLMCCNPHPPRSCRIQSCEPDTTGAGRKAWIRCVARARWRRWWLPEQPGIMHSKPPGTPAGIFVPSTPLVPSLPGCPADGQSNCSALNHSTLTLPCRAPLPPCLTLPSAIIFQPHPIYFNLTLYFNFLAQLYFTLTLPCRAPPPPRLTLPSAILHPALPPCLQ